MNNTVGLFVAVSMKIEPPAGRRTARRKTHKARRAQSEIAIYLYVKNYEYLGYCFSNDYYCRSHACCNSYSALKAPWTVFLRQLCGMQCALPEGEG